MEDYHLIACVLCSSRMKSPCFSYYSTLYQRSNFLISKSLSKLKKAPTSWTKIPISLKKGLYFNDQSSHISVLKTRPRRLSEMVVQQCRIAIFYINIPKFEIKNCKDCFSRFVVGNWASPRTFSFLKKRI